MESNGENIYSTRYDQVQAASEWKVELAYYGIRTAMVILVAIASFAVPNINITLVIGGSVLGTVVTVILPIMFYNRAYSDKFKNLQKDKNAARADLGTGLDLGLVLQSDYEDPPFNDQDPLMHDDVDKVSQNDAIEEENQAQKKDEDEEGLTDKRRSIKLMNYFVLVIGCTIGLVGFVNAINEMIENGGTERLD